MPDGGFYLWLPVPDWARSRGHGAEDAHDTDADDAGAPDAGAPDAWVLAEVLARGAGMLVSPGEFYGEPGAGFVRVALVVPDDRLGPALERLVAAGPELPAMAAATSGSRATVP
jgi:aspartate/methionine/tyrosine aminotransferase